MIAQEAGGSDAGTEAYLVRKMNKFLEGIDLRAIVFAILYRTGFDRNELDAEERQILQVIQLYPHFKIGEIWSDIRWNLK